MFRGRRSVPAVVAASIALAGSVAAAGGDPSARVVVAVVDSATNPYHEWFHAGGPVYRDRAPAAVTPAVLDELGVDDDHIIRLTRTGDFEDDLAADRSQFDAVEPGELYWFEGTNVLAITFDEDDPRPLLADSDDRDATSHGIGTSAAVIGANPEAIVILAEGSGLPIASLPSSAESWAMSHPAVDIVSTSYGIPGSPPLFSHLGDSYAGVVERGKLHVGAADNTPGASPVDSTSGPWWTIGVAGFHEEVDDASAEGREPSSGSLPDVVSDFTQELPYCVNCEQGTRNVSGTSFATPRTAGTISAVLLEARRALGHAGPIVTAGVDQPAMAVGSDGTTITNWQLRRAIEDAAVYPATAGSPGRPPAPTAAPWSLLGYGLVSPDFAYGVVPAALATLGFGDAEPRTKSFEACRFMEANIRARHAYWDTAVFSQSFGTLDDPYLYC